MNRDAPNKQVLDTARAMIACGLNRGSAGNVSVRHQWDQRDGFIISPTGMDYRDCTPEDMVFVDRERKVRGLRKPSTEWPFHFDIYQHFANAGAIVHAHPPFATSLACMAIEIPPFHYMIARFGGKTVPCANYATFGTQELSDAIITALYGRCACLIANHGMVVYGDDLGHALKLAIELEALCEQYWRVLQIGTPKLLSDEEITRVLEKFGGYGQQ